MSEYQYYEFQALDRRLTSEEMEYMHSLSSRVRLTPTQAIFVYNYSDFRGRPEQVLAKYFDAMLYLANWGSRQLMFRFPKSVVDVNALWPYRMLDHIEISTTDDHVVLNIELHEEEGWGWVDGEGHLAGLIPLRDDIMRGDYRALYLAWLKAAYWESALLEEDEDLPEPSVPPNLQNLSVPLQDFIDFFEIDEDLVAIASQASPSVARKPEAPEQWIDALPEEEQKAFLLRLLNGEPYLDVELAARLREMSLGERQAETPVVESRRGITELVTAAEERRRIRKEKERQRAEQERIRKLDALVEQEPVMWEKVYTLIKQKQVKAYDEAVGLLVQLRELAEHQNQMDQFDRRIRQIHEDYHTLRGLRSRMKRFRLT
jgi:hypothetical protein